MGTFYNKAPVQAFKENEYPNLYLDFAGNKSLRDSITKRTDLVTFTRTSTGTYVGSDGLIKTAAIGTPRFDHDPVTGESKGLLVESLRTNIRTYSTGSGIFKLNGSFTVENSNDIIAPDGSNTTRKVTSPGGGQHSIDCLYFQIPLVSGSTYTVSCYYYATGETETSRRIALRYPFTYYSGTIILPRNQWVRKTLTFTHGGTIGQQVRLIDNDTTGFNTTSGAVMYLWGVQIEEGAFATSYIPTEAAAVTRTADVISIQDTNFSSWYNPTEGTLYAEAETVGNLTQQTIAGIRTSEASSANRSYELSFRGNGNGGVLYQVTPTVITENLSMTTPGSGKIAAALSPGSSRAAYDGTLGTLYTDLTIPSSPLSFMSIGSFISGGDNLNGHIKRLAYWSTALPSGSLQTITEEGL